MTLPDDLAALSRQLAECRRRLERYDHVEPGVVEQLAASVDLRLRDAVAGDPAGPCHLLTLMDEAEALRAALERARRALRTSLDGYDQRRRGQVAYRSSTGT